MNFKDENEKAANLPNPTDESSNIPKSKMENYQSTTFTETQAEKEPEMIVDEPDVSKMSAIDVVQVEDHASGELTNESSPINRVEMKKENKKRNFRGFASTLAAGIVGSVLTLTILPHTDYLKSFYPNAESQEVGSSQHAANPVVKAIATKPTAGSIADTVEHVSKTIVGISNYQQRQNNNFYGSPNSSESVQSGTGSGVIFQKNGDTAYIITNNHVVEGAVKLEISLYNGEKTTAEVVGTDALTDLAVLKIDAKYVNAIAEFGDSSTLRPGDQVYAIGNPLGLNLSRTVTQGIISAIDRSIPISTSAGTWNTNVIQTDAAINPGNSGGALINPQGYVIGINSLKISENGVEGLGFAIPSNDLIPIVNELIKNGKVERPYLGVGLADLDQIPQLYWPNNVQEGVMVSTVEPGSSAANAGIQPKDVIVSMNGTKITNSSELRKYLYTKVSNGDEIKMEVNRDGKIITLTVKLAK